MKGGGGYSRGRGERVGLGGHGRDESAGWELRLGYVKGKIITSYLQLYNQNQEMDTIHCNIDNGEIH